MIILQIQGEELQMIFIFTLILYYMIIQFLLKPGHIIY